MYCISTYIILTTKHANIANYALFHFYILATHKTRTSYSFDSHQTTSYIYVCMLAHLQSLKYKKGEGCKKPMQLIIRFYFYTRFWLDILDSRMTRVLTCKGEAGIIASVHHIDVHFRHGKGKQVDAKIVNFFIIYFCTFSTLYVLSFQVFYTNDILGPYLSM